MGYLRVVLAAAMTAALAACSFFETDNHQQTSRHLDQQAKSQTLTKSVVQPARSVQLAALPGYLSDGDLVPADAGPARGFIGSPERRPAQAPAAVPERGIVPARKLAFADFAKFKRDDNWRPESPVTPVSLSIQAPPPTLADVVVDHQWRQRTSRNLERLFQ